MGTVNGDCPYLPYLPRNRKRNGDCPYFSSVFAAAVVAPRFGAVAAAFHRAPAAGVGAAAVEEEPGAGAAVALGDAREIGRDEKIGGRARDRPEGGGREGHRLEAPGEGRVAAGRLRLEPQVGEGLFQGGVEGPRRRPPVRPGRGRARRRSVEALAQGGGPRRRRCLRARRCAARWSNARRVALGGRARSGRRRREVGVALELVGLGAVAIPPAVDEIEAEGPAGELERARRGRGWGRPGRSRSTEREQVSEPSNAL